MTYNANFEITMEGGNKISFVANIVVKKIPCTFPIIPGEELDSLYSQDIMLDSFGYFWIREFALTNQDSSCDKDDITAAISPASSPVTIYQEAHYRFYVKPNSYSTV